MGIIGCGNNGYGHFKALRRVPEARITALADAVPAQAERWVAELAPEEGRPLVTADPERMWDAVDAVWICTPPGFHGAQVRAALEAGKHVMCEKPLTLDLAEGDALVRLAREKGLKLMAGYCLRFQPRFAHFKELVASGRIGELVYVWCTRTANRTSRTGTWRDDIAVSGGMLFETFTHNIDWMRHVAGEVTEVFAVEHTLNPVYNFEDHAFGAVRFAGGASGEFKSSWSSPVSEYVWGVLGTKAQAVPTGRDGIKIAYLDGTEEVLTVGVTDQLFEEDRHFVDAVLNGKPLLVDGVDSLKTLEVHFALKLSAREGRPVRLPLENRAVRITDFARRSSS